MRLFSRRHVTALKEGLYKEIKTNVSLQICCGDSHYRERNIWRARLTIHHTSVQAGHMA